MGQPGQAGGAAEAARRRGAAGRRVLSRSREDIVQTLQLLRGLCGLSAEGEAVGAVVRNDSVFSRLMAGELEGRAKRLQVPAPPPTPASRLSHLHTAAPRGCLPAGCHGAWGQTGTCAGQTMLCSMACSAGRRVCAVLGVLTLLSNCPSPCPASRPPWCIALHPAQAMGRGWAGEGVGGQWQ